MTKCITNDMAKTIAKTFRVPIELAREIEKESEKKDISQGQYLINVFCENKTFKIQKEFEEDLKLMEKDTAYQKEQLELAKADFL